MYITNLGHAGFCVETDTVVIIMDPWLSPKGAYDSAWFQFPRNHHLASYVQDKLHDSKRERFIYISHEHQDHFDLPFLESLENRDFTLILPLFRRKALQFLLKDYRCKEIVNCTNRQKILIPGGFIRLELDDSELNRDSAILVEADGLSFLNLNDCKLYDILPEIVSQEKQIDVFTCQFSGATWHPTCYEYPQTQYEAISKKKMLNKFETVAKAIEVIRPRVFLPSAGPACFLDPNLFPINFEPVNIFPRAPMLINFLNHRLQNLATSCHELMPGDVLDVAKGEFIALAKTRVNEDNLKSYLREYAADYEKLFTQWEKEHEQNDANKTLESLRFELLRKLDHLPLAHRIPVPLYFQLNDTTATMLRVDFAQKSVEHATEIKEENYYFISAPAWQIARILARQLTWEDFTLTFRVRLKRNPDVYQPILHAFLVMEAEDLKDFCTKLLQIEAQSERVVIKTDNRKYEINRYCPHQGGDLCHSWVEENRYLTCPRHRWQFDLAKGGQCTTNDTSLHAVSLED
jgi:UDP-MurNAc hydroxylase